MNFLTTDALKTMALDESIDIFSMSTYEWEILRRAVRVALEDIGEQRDDVHPEAQRGRAVEMSDVGADDLKWEMNELVMASYIRDMRR